jgi:hypothetical protein
MMRYMTDGLCKTLSCYAVLRAASYIFFLTSLCGKINMQGKIPRRCWHTPGPGPRRHPLSNASIDQSGDPKRRRVRVDEPGSPLHGRAGERVGDDLDHDGKPYVTVLLDGETAEVALDPATLVAITPEEEGHRITAYDVQIEVRHAGESTYAEGWVIFGGERHHLVVAASSSDRGTTYILDGETHWWSEIRWLDEWFEGLWMDAAAGAGYGLDNEIDFDVHRRSEERNGE